MYCYVLLCTVINCNCHYIRDNPFDVLSINNLTIYGSKIQQMIALHLEIALFLFFMLYIPLKRGKK